MRPSPLSLFGSLAAAVLCAAVGATTAQAALPPRPALACQTPPAPVSAVDGASQKEQNIAFRYLKPSEFTAQLAPSDRADKQVAGSLVPSGVTSLSPDDTKNCLIVKGTPEAIKQIENIARLLDVNPRQVRLQVRILRAPASTIISPNGKLPETRVVTTAEANVRNNAPLNLNVVGDGQLFRVYVTPHINGDQTVSLSAEFSGVSFIPVSSQPASEGAHAGDVNIKNSRSWTRRVAGGARTVFASVPDEVDHAAAYYLEITPVVAGEKNP